MRLNFKDEQPKMLRQMFPVVYPLGNNKKHKNKKMPVVCVLLSLFLTFVHDSFDSASKSKSCVVTGAFIYL